MNCQTDMGRKTAGVKNTKTLPVKPRGHLQVYCGGAEGWLIVMHVAPFKQLFGFIRQASPTYWQNSPIHPGEQAHCKKEARYLRYAGTKKQLCPKLKTIFPFDILDEDKRDNQKKHTQSKCRQYHFYHLRFWHCRQAVICSEDLKTYRVSDRHLPCILTDIFGKECKVVQSNQMWQLHRSDKVPEIPLLNFQCTQL